MMTRPARRALAAVARLTAVGGGAALLCLGAALVAPAASAAPTTSAVDSAAFLAGNPCDLEHPCGPVPESTTPTPPPPWTWVPPTP